VYAVVLYAVVVIGFTVVSLYVSPVEAQTGTLRPLEAIPDHLALLIVGGLALGLFSSALSGRLDLTLVVSIPVFVVLLDVDHLPSALGIAQPVRPAHSLIFVVLVFLLMATIIKRPDFAFAAMSGFFAHVGIDSGIFTPWAPVSFDYYTISDYRWPFLALAVVSAVAAGYYSRRVAKAGLKI